MANWRKQSCCNCEGVIRQNDDQGIFHIMEAPGDRSMHRNKLLGLIFFIICLAASINACAAANTPAGAENASEIASAMAENVSAGASAASENAPVETKMIRIIGTSDLHGKFVPWDYALNQESLSGSLAQLSTAIQEYRTENTLLMDAGDTIQDNSAEIFLSGDDVHPMVQAINALNYDVWVTGNHDYNYGMEITKKTIADLDCKVLTGNVYDKKGERIADGCTEPAGLQSDRPFGGDKGDY